MSQGSVLGQLFLSIYINDLVTVSSKLEFVMYADDTTIYFNVEDFYQENIENEIDYQLNQVSK